MDRVSAPIGALLPRGAARHRALAAVVKGMPYPTALWVVSETGGPMAPAHPTTTGQW